MKKLFSFTIMNKSKNITLQVKNVSKIYTIGNHKVTALNKISLDIKEGEFVAIVGPSGSGKSTLMHMIGCLDNPTSGNIYLDNHNVSQLNEDKLAEIRNHKIGFVFQKFNLLARTSALENVALPLYYNGTTEAETLKKAELALESVGLGDRVDHYPNQLSGGQQQRVAIARALVTSPSIILADEPTGNLDSKSSQEIMEIFQDLHRQGRTIILVTHDDEVAEQAHRVIKIKDGIIQSDI